MDKKDGKVNISIFDIHVIDVYFTSVYSNPSVIDTGSVAKSSNSKRELQNKQRLVKVNKGIFDIYMLLMCILLVFIVTLGYLIPVQLLILAIELVSHT